MNRSLALATCITLFLLSVNADLFAQKGKHIPPGGVFIEPKNFSPNPQSSLSEAGRLLFQTNNCASCHSVAGKGGCLAPLLDGIGSRRNKEFILARITDSPASIQQFQKLHGSELMPHVRVVPRDASLITAYLLTLPEPKGGVYVLPHVHNKVSLALSPPIAKNAASAYGGKELFFSHGCIACHSIANIGGHFGPQLDAISKRRTRQFVTERINNAELITQTNPDEYQGRGNVMPPSNLTDDDIKAITDFLMKLPSKP